jgi:hypothetical protein
MSHEFRRSASVWKSTAVIALASAVLIVITALAIDNRCYRSLRADILPYPGATIVRDEHQFLSRSLMVYATTDSMDAVDVWYREEANRILREQVVSGNVSGLPWRDAFTLDVAPDGRTLIIFALECS